VTRGQSALKKLTAAVCQTVIVILTCAFNAVELLVCSVETSQIYHVTISIL
jgi:hypothetical protein